VKKNALYDLVIFGAASFAGRFVTEYLAERGKTIKGLRWAIAGRSRKKLEQLSAELGLKDVDILIADVSDRPSIDAMVASATAILTTVGPYQAFGTPLVESCALAGTDYLDLSGEPNWMREMIDAYESVARKNGARILFSCGFDSIPSELGVYFLQKLAKERFGAPLPRVRGRIVTFIGGPGGGSVATGMAMMKAAQENADFAKLMQDPFALTPSFRGPAQPTGQEISVEPDVGPVYPFKLGPTDAKNVHRSNFLMNHPYGKDFVYDEMLVGEPPAGTPPSLADMPKPGEGPGAGVLADGKFEMLFIGSDEDGRQLRAKVAGARDPGFVATSRMMIETALLLLEDPTLAPGIWTPGAAFTDRLIAKLGEHGEMTFEAVRPS
jgi:short subunit dehydrogenase-like uncharacterized protein